MYIYIYIYIYIQIYIYIYIYIYLFIIGLVVHSTGQDIILSLSMEKGFFIAISGQSNKQWPVKKTVGQTNHNIHHYIRFNLTYKKISHDPFPIPSPPFFKFTIPTAYQQSPPLLLILTNVHFSLEKWGSNYVFK